MKKSVTQLDLPLAVSPVEAPAGALRHLQLGSQIVSYRFRRGRRRSIGLSVGANGLSVAAPGYTPIREVEAFIHEKSRWVLKKLTEWRNAPKPQNVTWADGEKFALFGDMVAIELVPGKREITIGEGSLRFGLAPDAAPAAVRKRAIAWLKASAREFFAGRIQLYAERLRVPAPTLALSSARTQWGICTEGGHVRINWRLVHLPVRLIDYVVAHELAHLKQMNHSRRFWAVVESLYPDYEMARRELRDCDHRLPIL
jgi:predicted metal-dependent hydrolase